MKPEIHGALALEALGNPVRRQIVQLLGEGPVAVGALAAQLPISRPAVSKHLRILEEAKLVSFHQVGNKNVFQLEQEGFESAKGWLDSFWDNALARFALLAENPYSSDHE